MADGVRGQGVGGALLRAAGAGLPRRSGLPVLYLTTFAGLDAARRLCKGAGFVLTGEAEAESWCTRVSEQRFTPGSAARCYR